MKQKNPNKPLPWILNLENRGHFLPLQFSSVLKVCSKVGAVFRGVCKGKECSVWNSSESAQEVSHAFIEIHWLGKSCMCEGLLFGNPGAIQGYECKMKITQSIFF